MQGKDRNEGLYICGPQAYMVMTPPISSLTCSGEPTQEKQERLCNSKRNWAVMRHDVNGDKCDAVDESRVQQ
jgi:hypothetical protein